jgi:hypothetical protein
MKDANERLHQDWIGMAQPDGLVVTTAALKDAEANITWPVIELQAALEDLAGETKIILDHRALLTQILGWSEEFLVERDNTPESLRVALDGNELLSPSLAVRSADDPNAFAFLVVVTDKWNAELDAATDDKRWTASPHQKFERLLRESGVHAGLLMNGQVFRLVYAPKGESAGSITFRLSELLSVDGRSLLGAFHMLLNERRLLSLEPEKRLIGLLKASREYQNTVSNALREQVLTAVRELLRGFEHADLIAKGTILGELRRENLKDVYIGLVTVLMRMVFVLFAEERGLLPMEHDLYASSYSLTRLYAQLLEDRGRFGDGLDDRYGAWARVITLFRLLHDGVKAADGLALPARRGDFFSADAFPFLEGRSVGSARQMDETLEVPRISDGVVFRVLDNLLVLKGERLQYRGLDVEQIGSVYEGLMGFELEVAQGKSLCLTPEHVVVNLEELLEQPGPERVKTLKAKAGLDLKDKAAGEVKKADNIESLQAALSRRNSARQPGLIAMGSLYLQPGEERRKSGSHYTPKSLTSPIVEATLRPVLERLGGNVTPEQLLDLKICDPAMGSAAFLVEACRQLADHLVGAWRRTGTMPELPKDEDPVLHARRLIAQRCLYGVDKNPLAVNLARLSMWLVTFAKEHPFTFVDHALRAGDSLVGLSNEQIASFSLDVTTKWRQVETVRRFIAPAVQRAEELRNQIHSIGDPPDTRRLVELWADTNDALHAVRMLGDLVVASFFSEDSEKARRQGLEDLAGKVEAWMTTGQGEAELQSMVTELREGEKFVIPFHWEIEFPEVFTRENPGFDCVVGNPPFLGGRKISGVTGPSYLDWITDRYESAGGQADLVCYFFRRSFAALRNDGTFGLIATNTISQGDSRRAGLSYICRNGGTIYSATKRIPWPGAAAVVVSSVNVVKGAAAVVRHLNGKQCDVITAYLFHAGTSDDPSVLPVNSAISFKGQEPYGRGFIFSDDMNGANPISQMADLIARDPKNQQRIRPYLGGEDFLGHPDQHAGSFVIDFGDCTEAEARGWPDLFTICEQRVRTERASKAKEVAEWPFWRFWRIRQELRDAVQGLPRILMHPFTSTHLAFSFVPTQTIVSSPHVVIASHSMSVFACLQSRVHEAWARFFASSHEDRLRYTPSDCFETFPIVPVVLGGTIELTSVGSKYYELRAAIMMHNREGLTDTYNRFHDADERGPQILELRELHAAMDRAVLDAFGLTDIRPAYDFREQPDENIRLTWHDDTRDEVLARLLELNRVMAEAGSQQAAKPKASKKKRAAKGDESSGKLFGDSDS